MPYQPNSSNANDTSCSSSVHGKSIGILINSALQIGFIDSILKYRISSECRVLDLSKFISNITMCPFLAVNIYMFLKNGKKLMPSSKFAKEKTIITQMQKCQRNWDYSKNISEDIIDYLLWIVQNSPSKQHEAYYDIYWTADRKVIEECSKYTWGNTFSRNPPACRRNSQANANMYMVFVAKEPETHRNTTTDGSAVSNESAARWENAYVSIGIAMGLVMQAANSLGLVTGCNKSHGDMNGDLFWEKKLDIVEDFLAGRKKIAYGIGIGYPQSDKERWETDEYELVIGASNGAHLTTYNEEDERYSERKKLPYPNDKKFRKVKIVDINSCDEAVDPYGNTHIIPNDIPYTIHTQHERKINVKEIK